MPDRYNLVVLSHCLGRFLTEVGNFEWLDEAVLPNGTGTNAIAPVWYRPGKTKPRLSLLRLTEAYIEALLVDAEMADLVWEAWEAVVIDDHVATISWLQIKLTAHTNA